MADKDADVQKIKELIKIMKENDLVEIDIKHGDDQIALRRAEPAAPTMSRHRFSRRFPAVCPVLQCRPSSWAQSPAGAAQPEEDHLEIKSPIVGTFYEAPSPDSDPYVEIGSHVTSQTVVCIIEAMKVMNEIKAEVSGTVVDRCVTNGQAIEYGQVLFKIKPD